MEKMNLIALGKVFCVVRSSNSVFSCFMIGRGELSFSERCEQGKLIFVIYAPVLVCAFSDIAPELDARVMNVRENYSCKSSSDRIEKSIG
jgi:hypothetical protein